MEETKKTASSQVYICGTTEWRFNRFKMEARTIKKWYKFVWMVAEAFVKRWSTAKELEIPDIPWLSVDDGILRLREFEILDCICCVKFNSTQWEGPEDVALTNPIRHKLVREAPAHLKSSVVALFIMPDEGGEAAASCMN